MDLVGAKVIVLILLGLIKLFSGLAPLLLVKLLKKDGMKWMENFMGGLMCFGGGVLLATVFIHMLPEVRDSLAQSYADSHPEVKSLTGLYPFGEVVLCGGFFVIYMIEASVTRIFNIHGHSHGVPTGAPLENGVSSSHQKDVEMNGNGETNPSFASDSETKIGSTSTIQMVNKDEKKKKPELDAKAKEKKFLSAIRSFVIVLALSIHAIFEGMAIGLQLNETDVWKLFIAVAIHECAILFCVGNEMVANGLKRCQMISYMITLALVTPIGMIIGIILTIHVNAESASQTLVIGLLQGLAGGTLLYVTFYEVLEREKLEKIGMTGILGCCLIVLGFGLMAGLEAAGGHDHSSKNSTMLNSTLSNENSIFDLSTNTSSIN